MEFYEIEKRIEYLIERVKKYSPKLLIVINDALIEYGKEMFDKLNVKKVYIVDEIIDYFNKNYELKNMAFFAPQGIIESNMYQKNFKYTRLYNLNADNVMESLNNALFQFRNISGYNQMIGQQMRSEAIKAFDNKIIGNTANDADAKRLEVSIDNLKF